jgi:hypothetical protein
LLPLLASLELGDDQAALINAVLASADGDAGDAIIRPATVLTEVLRDPAASPAVRPATAFQ